MDNIATEARAYLEKECRKLIFSMENALNRRGVTEQEINNLRKKIDINMYLQNRCE